MSGFPRDEVDKNAHGWYSAKWNRSTSSNMQNEVNLYSRLQNLVKEENDRSDDTETLFQLPVKKKIKFDDDTNISMSPAEHKSFPKYESHIELLNAKAEGAKLQNKLNAVSREFAEAKATFEVEKDKLIREKQEIEYNFRQIGKELKAITEKENELRTQFFTTCKEHEKEKRSLHEQIQELMTQNEHLEGQLAEANEENSKRQKSFVFELTQERKRSDELGNLVEKLEGELLVQKSRSSTLAEKLKRNIELLAHVEKKCEEQAITLKEWRQENQIAIALRHDVSDLKCLRQENEFLKQQNQKFKNLSENTALLKQQKGFLEEEVARLKKLIEKFVGENNEIKLALSKHGSSSSSPLKSLNEIDVLSAHCLSLKRELENKEGSLKKVEETLVEKQKIIDDLQNKLSNLSDNIENRDAFVQTDLFIAENMPTDVDAIIREKDDRINFYMKKLGLILDYDPESTDVVHFTANPLDEAHTQYINQLQHLQEANSILKIRIEELEKLRNSLQQDKTPISSGAEDITLNVQKQLDDKKNELLIENLRGEIKKVTDQRDRVAQTYKELSSKFRETCAYLTGYQIKLKENDFYSVQSIYERAPERSFSLKKGADGEFQLLANEYGNEWSDFVEMYLMNDNCFPAFLAAVTLQLFNKEKSSANLSAV